MHDIPWKWGQPDNSQQGRPYFPLWPGPSFQGGTYGGADAAAVVLHRAVRWTPAWRTLIALICHMQVTLPCPSSHQYSPSEWHFWTLLFHFIAHGRTKERKLRDRCAANANTNPSHKLSGAELQLHQQQKFHFLLRSGGETCSLACPYPAWLLSCALRNTIPIFSERKGKGAWPEGRTGGSAVQWMGTWAPKKGIMLVGHLAGW